jgi:hypothetical protein
MQIGLLSRLRVVQALTRKILIAPTAQAFKLAELASNELDDIIAEHELALESEALATAGLDPTIAPSFEEHPPAGSKGNRRRAKRVRRME